MDNKELAKIIEEVARREGWHLPTFDEDVIGGDFIDQVREAMTNFSAAARAFRVILGDQAEPKCEGNQHYFPINARRCLCGMLEAE